MKHIEEEELILHCYGEAENGAQIEQHLRQCDACRAQLAAIRKALKTATSAPLPLRGADYGAEVWQRLKPRLSSRGRPAWSRRAGLRTLALSAAALILITVGFFAGRIGRQRSLTPSAPLAADDTDRILLAAVGEHLQRSEVVFLQYLRTEQRAQSTERFQEWADALTNANRLYRQVAIAHHEESLVSLLDELEPLLVEMKHNSSEKAEDALAERIQAKDLLFKIRVVESQLEQRATAAKQSWSL